MRDWLLKPVMAVPETAELKDARGEIWISGMADGQKVQLTAGLCAFPALFVTADDGRARHLAEDFRFYLGEDAAFYFDSREITGFQVEAASRSRTLSRLEVLSRLVDGSAKVIVAPLEAVMLALTPQEIFAGSCKTLKPGDELDPYGLIGQLMAMGYERVDMVEGPGQVAMRGGIMDVYSIRCDNPVRMEFFGDEIDSIRSFNAETQRSIESVKEAVLWPAGEVVVTEESRTLAIKGLRDEQKKLRRRYADPKIVERMEERLSIGIADLERTGRFEGMDNFLPYFYPRSATLLDYIQNGRVYLDEPSRIRQRASDLNATLAETFKYDLESGRYLPDQIHCRVPFETLLAQLMQNGYVAYAQILSRVEGFQPSELCKVEGRSPLSFLGHMDQLGDEIAAKVKDGWRVVLAAGSSDRARGLVQELQRRDISAHLVKAKEKLLSGDVVVDPGSLSAGYVWPEGKLAVLSELDIYGNKKASRRRTVKKGSPAGAKITAYTDLEVGEAVVHEAHGIGVYEGIQRILSDGKYKDCLVIRYQGGKLNVPTEQMDRVQKYIGSEEGLPRLNKLGGADWSRTKKKVEASIEEMTEQLVALYATRQAGYGHAYAPDTPWQRQFEENFPYQETPDQITCLAEIKADMEQGKVMDRLLCGDVGYGKTEVALRAAMKAVMDGKQVAFLAPTTILAHQHYNTMCQRFANFAVKVAELSRFLTAAEQRKTLKRLAEGNVDIIVGTHRLLGKDVKFKDLGLLIVDEEQRFGVAHKERIKMLRKNVDVLTLTATPIPRTLHMSMVGIRDISVLETPPEERYPVQTYVMEYDAGVVREAIMREIGRGGQVYFIYNRVESMPTMFKRLQELVPEARILMAHGQMPEKALEKVTMDFMEHEGDILLCTTIIETGMDIPNVNTLIVSDADRFGLSQLYQLRGRVGRSNRQAYAYLTYRRDKVLSEVAQKRLVAIREFTEFGSGFRVALRDLQIRGAGNLLGTQQHGHMSAVGYDMYCRMMEKAMRRVKGEEVKEEADTLMDVRLDAYLPDEFIPDGSQKIEIYKRIAAIESEADKGDVLEEIIDRFGDVPQPVMNLITIAYLKSLSQKLGIASFVQREDEVTLRFLPEAAADPAKLFTALTAFPEARLINGEKVKIHFVMKDSDKLLDTVQRFLEAAQ
ncbi:transcription-repair coupling factor [Gehongia tenuis]|uniref:Transcription-repair-coupling factor n=1 Tax=Gehongia tenuis TaxID=2763655 RepID=A0A926D5Z5_9FIRM|nr:transcription-repair coupling factor [Gehongia tenuis]